MFLATAATRRPIAVSSLLIALVILGLNSYRKLSLENLPALDVPYVTVTTIWPGAAPEDIEKDIAKTIEDAVSGVEGLKHISTSCIENVGNVMIEFNTGVNVDTAAQDVREKVDAVISQLPADAERPVIKKLNVNATSVCTMFLSGEQTTDDLFWYADNNISDRFASVGGVADVQVIGGAEREIWVELDRDKLAAAGLTASHVIERIKSGILSVPGGRIRQDGMEYSVKFDAEPKALAQIEQLQIAGADGARVYLADLGNVRYATEEVRQKAFLNGRPGVAIKVIKKSDGNTVETVRNIRKRFDELSATLPAGMHLEWLQDDASIVQANVNNTISDIISSVILCAVILFAFLINLRTTFIVAITMPITIVISLFFMNLAHITLNLTSLLAIGLSSGILVSNSIVVLENIARRFEDTPDRWEAARIGTDQVTVAVLASAGTNVVVMIPIAMMTSIVGQFFAPFALTTLIVNFASIFVSFTLTPMLCAIFMRNTAEQGGRLARCGRAWEALLSRWGRAYANFLLRIGRHRAVALAIVVTTVVLFVLTLRFGTGGLGFSMVENDDWGRVFIRLEFPDYYDFDRTCAATARIAEKMLAYPDVETVLSLPGRADAISSQASEGVYLAQIEIVCKGTEGRSWSIEDRLSELRADLAKVPDLISTVTIPGIVSGSQSTLTSVICGEDLTELTTRAQKLQRLAFDLPGVAQLDTTARDDKPEVRIVPDRPIMADIGLDPSALGVMLRANLDGVETASFKQDVKTIDVRVKLSEREGVGQVAQMPFPAEPGRAIPLEAFTHEERTGQKVMIFRYDKVRGVTLTGNERAGYAAGTVMDQIEKLATDNGIIGTDGYHLAKLGASEMLGETVADFGEAILLAALLTFLTLAAILESFSRPLVVLTTFPMCLIGVIWALKATGLNISIFVLLGVLMLIGVVVNAAVLIADKAQQNLVTAGNPFKAMCDAVAETFRAVLMVVIASGLGMVPLAMSKGIGAINRIGIGVASATGIIVAGVLTLIVLPMFERLRSK